MIRLHLTAALALLFCGTLAAGGELTPEQIAKIRRDEKEELKKVQAAHGNKKSNEMSNEERRALMADQAKAANAAYEKNGVSAKDFAQSQARLSRGEEKAAQAEEKRLEAKATAEAAAKGAGKKGPAEIEVQQGFNDANPVDLEEKQGAAPKVDYGTAAETTK